MNIIKNDLIGFEGTIIKLSNKLTRLGFEDVCCFGNWEELLEDGNAVVSCDNDSENAIQIYYNVVTQAGKDEVIEATIIEITDVEEF